MSRGVATINLEPLKEAAISLREEQQNHYHTICQAMGPDIRVVMIGEATHGTEEFYRHRADISRILIEHYGFNGVAVEADWPDAYRINRYVCGHADTHDKNAIESVTDFERFPTWMWRNHATVDFIEWLRAKNMKQEAQHPCGQSKARHIGFYGLDLYSLFTSMDQVLSFLDKVNPDAAQVARDRYSTLGMFREEEQEYGVAVSMGLVESQEKQVTEILMDFLKNGSKWIKDRGGFVDDDDELFYSTQNAQLVKDAESYYRNMLRGGASTWNIRDTHMFHTLQALLQYHTKKMEKPAKIILWAHNSHLGDASASELRRNRELNLGQLVRQKLGKQISFNVGFSTFRGTVSAARQWGGKRETMTVNESLPESYEMILHRVAVSRSTTKPTSTEGKMETEHDWTFDEKHIEKEDQQKHDSAPLATDHDFMLILRSNNDQIKPDSRVVSILTPPKIQRAIGVCYVKKTERQSHYILQTLPQQFDCMIHIDETNALTALDG